MKILLVYNPQAGSKHAKKLLPRVEDALIQHKIDFDLLMTDYPEHATQLVKDADFNQYDGLVAAGGDGTLFEVINGYFQNPSKKRIPLGILPVGTGNAVARDLNLEASDWQRAIDIIASQQLRKVDVGQFTSHGQVYHFLNILGLGFVSDVTAFAAKRKWMGNIVYTLGVFYEMLRLKATPVRIELDGKSMDEEVVFIEMSNTRYTSNFLMAPNAKIDDGKLDVTICRKLTRRRLMQAFPKIFTGDHILMEEIDSIQASQIRIESDTPKIMTPDGEIIGITPVEVKCLHQAIEVYWQ